MDQTINPDSVLDAALDAVLDEVLDAVLDEVLWEVPGIAGQSANGRGACRSGL